mgnify:CR=1 FL=1
MGEMTEEVYQGETTGLSQRRHKAVTSAARAVVGCFWPTCQRLVGDGLAIFRVGEGLAGSVSCQ